MSRIPEHDWIDITRHMDHLRRYECAGCGAETTEPRSLCTAEDEDDS